MTNKDNPRFDCADVVIDASQGIHEVNLSLMQIARKTGEGYVTEPDGLRLRGVQVVRAVAHLADRPDQTQPAHALTRQSETLF